MLIDKKGVNNTFEVVPRMLFGNHIFGWRHMEDVDNPPVAGDAYSNILVYNDKAQVLAHIQVLFRPNNTWMIVVDYKPNIYQPIVLNGDMDDTKDGLLANIYVRLGETSVVKMVGLASIICRTARAMYTYREVIKEEEK